MKRLLYLFLLVACSNIYAQINFEPGYFIDNKGLKKECLIKNVAWKNNPVTFDYKLSENAEAQQALLKDVASFEVSGYKFIRFTVQMDRSSNQIDYLASNRSFNPVAATVFLKVLIEGTINLYSYEEGNLVKYFVSTGSHTEAEVTQLLFKKYVDDGSILENNYYQQQLLNFMRDEAYPVSTFEKLQYTKDRLTKIILKYNGSKGEVSDMTQTQNKGSFNLKVTAAAGLASISTTDVVYRYAAMDGTGYGAVDYDFKSAVQVGIGLEAECVLPFNNNKWSLFANPSLQFCTVSDDVRTTFGGTVTTRNWEIKYNVLEIPFGARHYMYLNSNAKIYLEAAYNLAVLVGNTSIDRNGAKLYDVSTSSNFALGAGFSYKSKMGIGVRYHLNRELLQYNIASATYSSIGLILNYKIL